MGGFYGSIHFRTGDRESVRSVLRHLAGSGGHRFLLAPPRGGWVTAFPNHSGQDEAVARAAAARFPGELLHVFVHDDDILAYLLLQGGEEVDRYCSKPDYFGKASDAEREACRGRPERLAHLLAAGHTVAELDELLRSAGDDLFAVHSLQELADLLGLPNALTSYEYLMRGDTDAVDGWEAFEHIPDRAPEIAAERAAAQAVARGWEELRQDGRILAEVRPPSAGPPPWMPWFGQDPAGPGLLFAWVPLAPQQQAAVSLWRLGPPWPSRPEQAAELDGPVQFVAVSPDGRWLLGAAPAAGSWAMGLWDLRDGERLAEIARPAGQHALWAAFAPDGSRLVVASPEEVVVAAVPTGERLGAIPLNTQGGVTGAVHPSGRLVLADGMGRVWLADLPAGPLGPRLFSGGAANVGGLLRHLAALAGTAAPTSWPVPDPEEQASQLREALERNLRREMKALRRRPDLLGAGTTPEEHEARSRAMIERQVAEHRERLERLRRNPQPAFPEQGLDPVRAMAFTPDGRRLVCSTYRGLRVVDWDHLQAATESMPAPRIAWDAAPLDPRLAGMPASPGEVITAMGFDVRRGQLIFADTRGLLSAMSLTHGTVRTLVELPGRAVVSQLAVSRDGAVLVTGCQPRPRPDRPPEAPAPVIQVWDLNGLSAGVR